MIVAGDSAEGGRIGFSITDVKGMRVQAGNGVCGFDAGLPVSIISILHSARHGAAGVFRVGEMSDCNVYEALI